MNRRRFLASLSASVPLALHGSPLLAAAPAAAVPEPAALATSGAQPLLSRYRLTRDRVLLGGEPAYTPEFLLEDIRATGKRRFTNFSGDVSGRWIGALAATAEAFGEIFPALEPTVQRIIAEQKPDGYFGKIFRYQNQDDDDMALLWGNGRLLVGLMEHYALNPSPQVLASARKLADFLVRIGPDFNTQKKADEFGAAHYGSSYICWTQQTEGLAAVYAVTRDSRYLDLCREIAKRIERRPSDHVHGYLCSLRGLVHLYSLTGDKAFLKQAVAEWNSVTRSGDLLITGGVPERWTPLRQRTEGCAECDWLRLGLALHRATGDAVYIEAAERAWFNEFSMNQFASGDFGHGELDANGAPTVVRTRAWWCCTLHGLRAFADVRNSVFLADASSITYALPLDGRIDKGGFTATSSSQLGTDGRVSIHIQRVAAHTLTIRKPSWAEAVTVNINGKAAAGLRLKGLKAGDVVTAGFRMRLVQRPATETGKPDRQTLSFGPWLLGATANDNTGYSGEHIPENHLVAGSTKPNIERGHSPFSVPIASTRAQYVSAEFVDQPGTLHLRPVAEQTAMPPATWETTFLFEKPLLLSANC